MLVILIDLQYNLALQSLEEASGLHENCICLLIERSMFPRLSRSAVETVNPGVRGKYDTREAVFSVFPFFTSHPREVARGDPVRAKRDRCVLRTPIYFVRRNGG